MKKVLVISYYFPPMGMGGVQRTAKFVKYLPEFGWEPVVLTVTPKLYLAMDECLLKELEDKRTVIYRTSNGNSSSRVVKFRRDSTRKFLSKLSQTVMIPDSKITWKKRAVELAGRIFREHKLDLIYSTAPPYTDFLVAKQLKKSYKLPLVLDYRDSWVDCPNNYYATPLHRSRHSKLEKGVLLNADSVVTINPRIRELILMRYPFVQGGKISIIPQGFDQADFDAAGANSPEGEKMRFTYAGSLLNYYTPAYFLEALSLVFGRWPGMRSKIEACFIGSFPGEHKGLIEKLGLESSVSMLGYMEHPKCVSFMKDSDVLWMMINRTGMSDLHSTGKLYEYFGARKPILACVPEGVARNSLNGYGAVKICEPDDVPGIARFIVELYELYASGKMPKPDERFISAYERKNLAGKLADEFGRVLESSEIKVGE